MEPIDYRNATWSDMQSRLTHDRKLALDTWAKFGPGTTRYVSGQGGIDILTFRPRTTELYQLGYLECLDKAGHEGAYRARTSEEFLQEFMRRIKQARSGQGELKIGV